MTQRDNNKQLWQKSSGAALWLGAVFKLESVHKRQSKKKKNNNTKKTRQDGSRRIWWDARILQTAEERSGSENK